MTPLSRMSPDDARRIDGVFFDLDDTALSHGVLSRETYEALYEARDSGLFLVAVTGRPQSWGEVIARQWPLEGVVVENGALAIVRDGAGIRVLDPCEPKLRAERTQMLAHVKEKMSRDVPELHFADDAWSRTTDVTWDIGERAHASEELIARGKAVIAELGAFAFASSVHLHATFERTDKAEGAVRFAQDQLGKDSSHVLARSAYVGDSSNDASCFAAFFHSFGVANVKKHVARLSVPPRFVASLEMGAGFNEVLRVLISARKN